MTHIQSTGSERHCGRLLLEIVTREKSPAEDAAKYSSATSKVHFEMCVCAALREANLTATQAPMQTDTIKKSSSGGAAHTHTHVLHTLCSLLLICSYKLLQMPVSRLQLDVSALADVSCQRHICGRVRTASFHLMVMSGSCGGGIKRPLCVSQQIVEPFVGSVSLFMSRVEQHLYKSFIS